MRRRILAYKEIQDFSFDEAIDWAVEMLMTGYETASLLILAGISKPTNSFETEEYLLASLRELNLKIPARKQAILGYCKNFVEEISRSKDVKKNLHQLYKVAKTTFDNEPPLLDFYLLYWAWDELDYGLNYQTYWPDATINNIELITIDVANKWLKNEGNSHNIALPQVGA